MEITIKKMKHEDLPILEELYLNSRKEFYWDTNKKLSDFSKHSLDEDVYVAWCDKNIVGFISVFAPENFVHLLFIDPAFFGKKVGKYLLEYVKNNYGFPLTLKCVIENERAVNFYAENGWEIVETVNSANPPYYLMKFD